MAKVLGIGGVFFKAGDVKSRLAWYRDFLGLDLASDFDGVLFPWTSKGGDDHATVFSLFDADTSYFSPSEQPFMVNFIVDDLDAMRAQLKDKGAEVLDEIEEMDGIGRFGWVMDPGGVKLELWEPAR